MTDLQTEPSQDFFTDLATAETRRAKKLKAYLLVGALTASAAVGGFVTDKLMGDRHYQQGYEQGDADGSVRGEERIYMNSVMKESCGRLYQMHVSKPELFANENFDRCLTPVLATTTTVGGR